MFFQFGFQFFSGDLILIKDQFILISFEKYEQKKGIKMKKTSNIGGMP